MSRVLPITVLPLPNPAAPLGTLTYARCPRWHQRSSFRRVLWVTTAIVVVLLVLRCGKPTLQRASLLFAQAQCATYRLPPGRVVHDSTRRTRADMTLPWIGYVRRVPSAPPFDGNVRGTALLHRLSSAATGGTRIVRVGVTTRDMGADGHRVFIEPWVVIPATWRSNATVASASTTDLIAHGRHIRFFTGSPDPADLTRFTIPYDVDGQPGTIEGRLVNDRSVSFAVVSGPAALPAWAPGWFTVCGAPATLPRCMIGLPSTPVRPLDSDARPPHR